MTNPSPSLARMRSAVIDMDGVLYHGVAPLHGAAQFLDFLSRMKVPSLLLTNNSTLTPTQYVDKLADMGIHVDEDRVLTSAVATGLHLAKLAPEGTAMYMVGEEGLRTELLRHGFMLRDSADVAYVVVGFDRHFTYEKMATASLAVRAGATFVGTNPDRTYPSEVGILPGAGAILASIEAATDVSPTIIGKPQRAILELALARLGAEAESTAIIGDRLDTDVLGGQRLGLVTILLLSGVTDVRQLAASTIAPDLVYEDVATLHEAWRKALET